MQGGEKGPLGAARVLAGAIAASLVMFAVLVLLMLSGLVGRPFEKDLLPPQGVALLVVLAALVLVAAPLVERLLLRKATAEGYVSAKAVGMALRELPGIVGCLLGLLTGHLLWPVVLPAASLLAIALGWPRARELAAVLEPGPGEPPATASPIEPE